MSFLLSFCAGVNGLFNPGTDISCSAGDPLVMAQTVALCKAQNIKVGAHVGLPDVQGFGRREMKLSKEEHTANIVYQAGALKAFLEREGMELHHVKPHGVLYSMMTRDIEVARAVCAGVPKGTRVFGLAGTLMEFAALEAGLEFWAEYYGDVKYRRDGSLIHDRKRAAWKAEDVKSHVWQQVHEQSVTTDTGHLVFLPVKNYHVSVCCHSDSPGCLEIVKAAKEVVDEFNKSRGPEAPGISEGCM